MKLVKLFMAALVCSFALISCNPIDRKLNALEKACKNKDREKFAKIADELDKIDEKDVTPEQLERAEKILSDCDF